jgi:hypothetical protein
MRTAKPFTNELNPPPGLKPADRVLWYHTVLGWIDQWVKPDRAEFQRRLTAASTSGTAGMETGTSR